MEYEDGTERLFRRTVIRSLLEAQKHIQAAVLSAMDADFFMMDEDINSAIQNLHLVKKEK